MTIRAFATTVLILCAVGVVVAYGITETILAQVEALHQFNLTR